MTMRGFLIAAAIFAFVAFVPSADAADLKVTSVQSLKRVAVKKVRHLVVRDYDGTPVLVRPGPKMLIASNTGSSHLISTYVHVPVMRAVPSRYFNGEPVQPTTHLRRRLSVY